MSFNYWLNCKQIEPYWTFKIRYLENDVFLNFYLFLKKSLFWVFIATVKVCTVSFRTLCIVLFYDNYDNNITNTIFYQVSIINVNSATIAV